MPIMFIFVVGIAVALIRRRLLVAPEERASQDAPTRLLGWAVGLLAAQREQWGQAMIGELDRLDGRARRWRFALGCVAAAVVLPPWGPAAAVLGALMGVAASGCGLALYTQIHYRLGTDGWTFVAAAILVLLVVGYILGGSVLLRRPGVAGPGLLGGLLVAAAWLTVGGFTFSHWLNSLWSYWWLLVLAPIVVGVGGTLWGGSAAVGRRAARLATVTAALSIYLYGVLAVAVLGATGHDPSDNWTPAQVVDDNLGNQAVFYLMALPLMTATIGWAAAAATARLRTGRSAPAPAYPVLQTAGHGTAPTTAPWATVTARRATQPPSHPAGEDGDGVPGSTPAPMTGRNRTWYVLLLCAALTAAASLVFLALLAPHRR